MCLAWLGYGNVLFLGLGEGYPPGDETGGGARPTFELETNFADWLIEGPETSVTADSERPELEALAESLVGEQVVSWNLLDGNVLRLNFTGPKVLTVMPWNVSEGLSDAWSVKSPDGRILAVATDGRNVVVDAAIPIKDWLAK